MAGQSTDDVILQAAWNLLWTPGTPYYLPNVMKNGLKWNSISIPPLDGSAVSSIGPITLFKDDVLGYISVTMSNNTVNGLSSITNGGMTYDDATNTLTITIGFAQLVFQGSYSVDSGGVTGCAISTANGLLNVLNMARSARIDADAQGDPNINLAYQYRDQLMQSGNANGTTLVNMFYDQNDTLNSIVLAQNATVNGLTNTTNGLFNSAWLTHTTNGKDTAFYMQNTSAAASNPTSTGTGFNDDDYNLHSFVMEVALTKEAVALQGLNDPRGTALYNAIYSNAQNNANNNNLSAAATSSSLDSEAKLFTGTSINAFMGYVQTGGSQSAKATAAVNKAVQRKAALYEKAKALVDEMHADWIKNNRHEEYAGKTAAFASINDTPQISGSFTDTFNTSQVTITVTVASQNGNLVVTVTDIEASIPSLQIQLKPVQSSNLNTEVQNSLANASFTQHLMKAKIESGMDTDTVKNYLSDRINQAITKIFG